MEMIILLRREQISSILVVYGVFTMEMTKSKADTRMHSSRIRTASSLPYGGGVSVREGGLCMMSFLSPLDRDPPQQNALTHACENITLPQTSFAGGKMGTDSR